MICLIAATSAGVASLLTPPPAALIILFVCLAMVRPLTQVHETRRGWHRPIVAGLGALVAIVGLVSLVLIWNDGAKTLECDDGGIPINDYCRLRRVVDGRRCFEQIFWGKEPPIE
jgi:hypothetical protein